MVKDTAVTEPNSKPHLAHLLIGKINFYCRGHPPRYTAAIFKPKHREPSHLGPTEARVTPLPIYGK